MPTKQPMRALSLFLVTQGIVQILQNKNKAKRFLYVHAVPKDGMTKIGK